MMMTEIYEKSCRDQAWDEVEDKADEFYKVKNKGGRPRKKKGKRGPKGKPKTNNLVILENELRILLDMPENFQLWTEDESAEQLDEHRRFLERQLLHASRISGLYVLGIVSGQWQVDPERAKVATYVINQVLGTPTQKVSVQGQSKETKEYVDSLLILRDKDDFDEAVDEKGETIDMPDYLKEVPIDDDNSDM